MPNNLESDTMVRSPARNRGKSTFSRVVLLLWMTVPSWAQEGRSSNEIVDWQLYIHTLGRINLNPCWLDVNGEKIPKNASSLRLYKADYASETVWALGMRRVEPNDDVASKGTITLDLGEWREQCYHTLSAVWRYSKSANRLQMQGIADDWRTLQQARDIDGFELLPDANHDNELTPCSSILFTTMFLQRELRAQAGADIEDTGRWNPQTNRALRFYLKALLEKEPWKEGWDKSTDTDYTDEVAAHLRTRIAAVEAELGGSHALTENLSNVIQALDCLKGSEVYRPDVGVEVPKERSLPNADASSSLPVPPTGNVGNGFMLSLANGFLYEFADEIGCKVFFSDTFDACHEKAKQDVLAAQAAGGMFTAVLNFIGILLSPIGSMFAVSRARSLHKTGGSAFLLGFKYEFFENMLMAIGEISTFGTLQNPEAFAQWGLAACVLTGIMVSARSR